MNRGVWLMGGSPPAFRQYSDESGVTLTGEEGGLESKGSYQAYQGGRIEQPRMDLHSCSEGMVRQILTDRLDTQAH